MEYIVVLIVLVMVIIITVVSPNQCSACNHDMGFGNNECEKCGYKN